VLNTEVDKIDADNFENCSVAKV